MKNTMITFVLLLAAGLWLPCAAQGQEVNSDGSILIDWFNRLGPDLGEVDFVHDANSLAWHGGVEAPSTLAAATLMG